MNNKIYIYYLFNAYPADPLFWSTCWKPPLYISHSWPVLKLSRVLLSKRRPSAQKKTKQNHLQERVRYLHSKRDVKIGNKSGLNNILLFLRRNHEESWLFKISAVQLFFFKSLFSTLKRLSLHSKNSVYFPSINSIHFKSATIERKLRPPKCWQACTRLINHKQRRYRDKEKLFFNAVSVQ